MEQRIIFFTGGTSGLGKVAALELAEMGHKVYLAARSNQKAHEIIHHFEQQKPADTSGELIFVFCDNNDLESVEKAIEIVTNRESKLDMLINNAGLWNNNFKESKDGIEQILQTNLIAPLILMEGFLPLLRKSDDARIINTASGLHQGTIQFDDIEYRNKFNSMSAYRQSKLGLILLTRLMHQEHGSEGIGFYAQHPGVVNTHLGRDLGWLGDQFFKLVGISPEKGAQTLLHLAKTDQKKLTSGEYYAKKKVKDITKESYNLTSAKRLRSLLLKKADEARSAAQPTE